MNENVLLEVSHLKKHFNLGHGRVLKAVDDVSFQIKKGETLGLVGESGCGKSTCGRTCLGMYNKTDGQVLYKGKDVHSLKNAVDFSGSICISGPENDGQRYRSRGTGCASYGKKPWRESRSYLPVTGDGGTESGSCQPLCP